MSVPIKTRKKLIEVALPLDAINAASAREKSIRHGHPSNLHRWWARRPFVSARAVIFAQMVDDPSEYTDTLLQVEETRAAANRLLKQRKKLWNELPDDGEREAEPTLAECAADLERERLFRIIEDLVQWENTSNAYVLDRARREIWQSWRRACADNAGHPRAAELFDRNKLPAFHDPFAGGGALPLEAQRLGLEAHASDLNPVAVLINRAMIEIPPRLADRPPINPDADPHRKWKGMEGLADDVRYYGKWMRDEAEKRIGHLYPKVTVTAEMAEERPDLRRYVGRQLSVIAWVWARTVKSPNPAFRNVSVPLASSFLLSARAKKEAYVEPVVAGSDYRFVVRAGRTDDLANIKSGTKLGRGSNFRCILSQSTISSEYVKAEGKGGRIGSRLMAVVAEGDRERVYLSPTPEQEAAAKTDKHISGLDVQISGSTQYLGVKPYGFETFGDLFTPRQSVALEVFSSLVGEATRKIEQDAEGKVADSAGTANDISFYLSLIVSKTTDSNNAFCPWEPVAQCTRQLFGRQAISMIWDFGEANPLEYSSGGFMTNVKGHVASFDTFPIEATPGSASQSNATEQNISEGKVICTDPPYYDNVPYADLADFFYVWLRKSLPKRDELTSTLATPKADELVAFAYRHATKADAEKFFKKGMFHAFRQAGGQAHPAFPMTIYYAFKQAEIESEGATASTGWEAFLEGVSRAGFLVDGTWPIRTEMTAAMKAVKNNLASSIVLVCRPRPSDAPTASRREFLAALKAELPAALHHLQRGNIAPVDLAQAAIGPGMAIFTRYAEVLGGDGKAMPVRDALAQINEVLDEVLAAQEGDFDPDTRWAVTWFDQFGFDEGDYGHAEQLSKAKNTAVAEMADVRNGGIVTAKAGKVKLTRPADLPEDWDPELDPRLTVWEMVHHLIRRLGEGGEATAAELVAKLGVKAEIARELAYRLYVICERKKRPDDARSYNSLVQSWPEITRLARDLIARGTTLPAQAELAI